jgi:hypothetical protein
MAKINHIDAAKMLLRPVSTLVMHIRQGKLKAEKEGSLHYIEEKDLEEYILWLEDPKRKRRTQKDKSVFIKSSINFGGF